MPGSSVEVNANIARILKTGIGIEFLTYATAVETADIVENNISSTTGTGKAYKRNGVVHVASSPGSYPVVDTGQLKNSIHVTLSKSNPEADLIIDVPYALDLELGTSRMRSRPFIRGSVNESFRTRLPEIIKRFIDIVENGRGIELFMLTQYARRFVGKSSQAQTNWKKRRGL